MNPELPTVHSHALQGLLFITTGAVAREISDGNIHFLHFSSFSPGQLPRKFWRKLFSFFRHLCSHLNKKYQKKGYFLFHIFTPFFLILICGHEILLNLFFVSEPLFLLLRLWMDRKFFSQFAQSV